MPRKIRYKYAGVIYHVMSRGGRGKDIFHDDVDRQDFVKTLAETCQKTGWQAHAWCLMGNHFSKNRLKIVFKAVLQRYRNPDVP